MWQTRPVHARYKPFEREPLFTGKHRRIIDSVTKLGSALSIGLLLLAFSAQSAFATEKAPRPTGTAVRAEAGLQAARSDGASANPDNPEELGGRLSRWSAVPFVLMLVAIAVIPLVSVSWWESHYNKAIISVICSLPVVVYFLWLGPSGQNVLVETVHDYYRFIVLLLALFTISGGIHLEGRLKGTPAANTVFLGAGALMASVVGTTGAAMLLIRPLLRATRERKKRSHVFIFLIFLVANIGGALLPVGDPPLFLGYIFGVPFFWTVRLWPVWLTEVALLLAVFYVWDRIVYAREPKVVSPAAEPEGRAFKVHGKKNLLLTLGVLLSVVFLKPLETQGTVVDLSWMQQPVMILLALISYVYDHKTKRDAHRRGEMEYKSPRDHNQFTFSALVEVAVLFAGIFITMTPAMCLLKAYGQGGGTGTEPWHFFWMSGGLSSFLDNTPTYAVYFALGQGVTKSMLGSAPHLPVVMATGGPIAERILAAVSLGSVFMGANTYIGNAPNFMVKSLCEEARIAMPSFFGYMVYSVAILVPSFLLITYLYIL